MRLQHSNAYGLKDQSHQDEAGAQQDLSFSKFSNEPISQHTSHMTNDIGRPPIMPSENRNVEFPSSELSYKTAAAVDKYKYVRQATPDSMAGNPPVQLTQEPGPTKPKSYDYLFVQMSNEQFNREFSRKVMILRPPGDEEKPQEKSSDSPRPGYRGPAPSMGAPFSPNPQGRCVP